MTALPATMAADAIPVRMASGKFHGAMITPSPRGRQCWKLDSPAAAWVRRGRGQLAHDSGIIVAEINRFGHVGIRLRPVLAGFQDFQGTEGGFVAADEAGGFFEKRGALGSGGARPLRAARRRRRQSRPPLPTAAAWAA